MVVARPCVHVTSLLCNSAQSLSGLQCHVVCAPAKAEPAMDIQEGAATSTDIPRDQQPANMGHTSCTDTAARSR